MENPEEVLHSLEEFSKMKPKDIPRELEEYLCFVAKTGNPVYQWPTVKSLFREKLISVITEFYESCPTIDIPPCQNVDLFNYELMKNFILEKLDTFAAAPFTVQRLCELLTTPRKEYNRIDKYMRALEKNILVVSTTEPGRRSTENGDGIMNGIESEHLPEGSNSSHDINIEDMDEAPSWPRAAQVVPALFENSENETVSSNEVEQTIEETSFEPESEVKTDVTSSTVEEEIQHQETVITCTSSEDTTQPFASIEAVAIESSITAHPDIEETSDNVSITITTIPANVQQRRTSIERVGESETTEEQEEATGSVVTEEIKLVENTQLQVIQEEIVVSELSLEPTELLKMATEQSSSEVEVAVEKESTENHSESVDTVQSEVSSGSEIACVEPDQNPEASTDPELDEQAEEVKSSDENEVAIKDTLTSEVLEKSAEPATEPASSTVTAIEGVVDSSTDSEEKESAENYVVAAVEAPTEEMKIEEAEIKAVSSEALENALDETLMEVDIVNEDLNKKEESEEPTSSVESSVDNPL